MRCIGDQQLHPVERFALDPCNMSTNEKSKNAELAMLDRRSIYDQPAILLYIQL